MMAKRSSKGARCLEGAYYVSRQIYAQEWERIFSRRWLYAGRASQLAEPGSYFLFALEPESVIVLRDAAGEVRAFYNVCPHRGTCLLTEREGRVRHSIQCPYHAWTFALDGTLLGAPNMSEEEGFSRADYPLVPVPLTVWEGGVFLNFASQPEPFEQAFQAVLSKFRPWRLSELTVAHRQTYEVQANWKLMVQNYSECYHCPTLHPQLNRLTPYQASENDLEAGSVLGGPMHLTGEFESMTMSGRACATPLVGSEHQKRVYYYVLFPNVLLSLAPDYVLVHQVLPEGPERSRVVCEWLFHPEAVAQPDFDPSGAIEFWHVTNQQDWEVCERTQKGVASQAYRPGPYGPLESMIAAFDREYFQALNAS